MGAGLLYFSAGACEIRGDCCWTAKHVGTGSPWKNSASGETSLLSLSTTE